MRVDVQEFAGLSGLHSRQQQLSMFRIPAPPRYERIDSLIGLQLIIGTPLHGQQVPEEQRHETPVYLFATAGMRLLPYRDQDAIMAAVSATLSQSDFRFDTTQVSLSNRYSCLSTIDGTLSAVLVFSILLRRRWEGGCDYRSGRGVLWMDRGQLPVGHI